MITVAHLINNIDQTGPAIVLCNIIRYLDRSKFRPIVICLRHENVKSPIKKELADLGVRCIYLNNSLLNLEVFTNQVARKLFSLLRDENVDILHSHCYHPDLLASKLSDKVKCITTFHNVSKQDFTYLKGGVLGRYMNFRYLYSFPKIGHYAAISSFVASNYAPYLKEEKEKIRTIYNSLDLSLFRLIKDEEKIELRKELGLPIDGNLFVVVGRLFSRKDPLIIVRAFSNLLKKGSLKKDNFLLFLGDGPLIKECQKVIGDQSDNIKLLGFKNNVHEYIMASDCSITASHSEGFGLNYLEAMACGKTVIATDLPPFREIVHFYDDMENLFFPIGDQKELENCIIKSLNYTLDTNKIKKIRELFSAELMSKKYQDFYLELFTE